MASKHRLGQPRVDAPTVRLSPDLTRLVPTQQLPPAHRAPSTAGIRVKQGVVVAAFAVAITAAGLGFHPHTVPKGADAPLGSALTAPPPAVAPVPADVPPDAPLTDPPLLTPSLHGHPSRLLRPQTAARVLATASQTQAVVPAPDMLAQTAPATLAPATAPVQQQSAPVPAQPVQTVPQQQPQTAWVPQYTPTYQQQYIPRSSRHHGRHYDYDHDGDNH